MNTPLNVAIALCAVVTFLCWLLSVIHRNYSQVDRIWSIVPIVYVGWFAYSAGFRDVRLNVMAVLVLLWGARLTFNFARKGGYKPGGEDYRWPVLQERLGPVKFQLFNATFIAPYQNLLLLLISLPAAVAFDHQTPFTGLDAVLALVFALALVGETIADQQQWNFHVDKQRKRDAGETITEPFLTKGLFRYSRHPNFFFEQTQWWCVYAFAVSASGTFVHLGLPGPVLLTLLFQGSSAFTESLTLAKYPSYAEYQKTTPRQFPLPRFGG